MGRSRAPLWIGFALAVASAAPAAVRASVDHPAPQPTAAPAMSRLIEPSEPTSPAAVKPAAPLSVVEREMRKDFPHQYAASEQANDPKSRAWALLIGINAYAGRTEDAVGSRQDAEGLKKYLVSLGWRSDHIMLVTDTKATASKIVSAIRWLASKTTTKSTVIFHFAGHEMPRYNDPDGDGEYRDVEFWASDNRYVIDRTVGRELGKVRAARMWIHLATCRAAGFDDPGMVKAGRIITYSSAESEFSYEDPDRHHSVFGYYVIATGMAKKYADRNRDGRIAVEEAYAWARPKVVSLTDGRQHPSIGDHVKGWFYLDFPKPPKKKSSGGSGSGSGSNPRPGCFTIYCI